MRGTLRSLSVLASLLVGFYGAWLLATVGSEFAPRGTIGLACVVVGVVVGLGGLFGLRKRRI